MANVMKRMLLPQFIRQYIVEPSRRSEAYKRQWRNIANKIEGFGKHMGKPIHTNSFTAQLMEEYVYWLKSSPKQRAANTIHGYAQRLNTTIEKANKAGFKVVYGYKDIIVKGEDAAAIYLTAAEIEAIFNLKGLTKEAHAARERFVVACCTGMRFGDIKNLNPDNFLNNKVVMKTRKTGAPVIVPQHWMVKAILLRNKGELPRLHSQQAYNTMVKRLCKKAGITEKVLVEKTRGLKIIRKTVPKYELVSSHTARRSLSTNLYLAGIPAARIMLITGHTTEQTFFKYIRINRHENADTLANHLFFKGT